MEIMIISAIASPIAKQIVDWASSLARKKYKLLQGLEDHIEEISSQLSAIQAVLEDAENKQLDSPVIRDWLQKLKEVLQDVEDTLGTFETEAFLWERENKVRKIHLPLSPTEISFKSDAANRIKKHLEKIEKISKERHNFQLNIQTEPGITFDQSRYTSFIVHECDVIGREEDKNEIVHLLLSQISDREGSLSVFPIIGMPGLGKTTLAQLVYNDARVTNHFEFKMWVCVTNNFNYSKILKDMLEYHTEMSHDLHSNVQLENRLLEFLSRKPFLLVLDDVWPETFEWEQLKQLLRCGGKGSRVLVTSRNVNVSNVMGTLQPYLLGQLPEDKSWSLFEKIAFDMRVNIRGELVEIGKEIVSKCDGLPLAIRAIGSLLRGNNDVKKWRNILKNKIWDVEKNSDTGKQELLPALNLSYNHLPSHLKRCFAFCSIYPKAYFFRKAELVKVWKAASLIISREEDSIDEIGSEYFDRLKSRSFFQLSLVDKEETYRMHDLFHDLALTVSSPDFCQVKDNRSPCNFSNKVRHVSLLCDEVHQPLVQVMNRSEKLRTILSPTEHVKNFGQALGMVFSLNFVRILDLSSSMMQELPDSVSNLKLLHYLDLSRTEIRRLPNSVCNLINLQTLKMLRCLWLFELPQGLGNLINLQHLELDDMFWHKLHKLPPRMGRMTGLQNLHAFHVLNESGYGIDELKDMMHLKGALHIMKLENVEDAGEANLKDKEDLDKIVFEWSSTREQDEAVDERILEDLQPHSDIKEVQIIHYLGNRFPSWLREGLTKNLISVSLKHCRKCRVLSLGRLTHLKELCLRGLLGLEEWVDAPYQNLQRLTISNCPELRALPQCFMNLRVMKVKKCNLLKTLPLAPSLQFLILLDNLVLEDFNEKVLMLMPVNGQGQHGQHKLHSFIHLLELKLINCPKLAKLPEIFSPQKLDISGCPLLSTLPTPEFSRRLQHLAIEACDDGTLVRAIPHSRSLYSLVISNISGISSLPKWPHLPGLKVLYISSCKDLVTLSEEEVAFEGLDSLEFLSIRDCPKLEMLPEKGLPKELKCLIISSCSGLKSLGHGEPLKGLTSLKDLYIENCPELEMLPEDGFSTSLHHLQMKGCPILAKQCQEGFGPDWPKIMDIPDLDLEVPSIEDPLHGKYTSKPWYHRFIYCKGGGTN